MTSKAALFVGLASSVLSFGMYDAAWGTLVDTFNAGGQGWQIYDYNGQPFGTEGGVNVFYPVTWESSGGVGDSGYVWADDSRWRIDTPETPDSILSFIIYQSWVGQPAVDLRNKTVSVYLRGDNLDLKGASVYFWAYGQSSRWHLTSRPLSVSQGAWGTKETFVLTDNESLWHNSWHSASLDSVLASCDSFGFSFVGFPYSQEVTGKFSMDELTIGATQSPEPASMTMVAIGGAALLMNLWRPGRPRRVARLTETPFERGR
jgi:hypothetical protein